MKRFLIPAVAIAGAIASSAVFAAPAAEGKTRAQVRAELIEARAAGLFEAPDASYPATQLRAVATPQTVNTTAGNDRASAFGANPTGRSESGRRTVTAPKARDSIYFGQ